MKYRQLRNILNGLSETQLEQEAMVHNIEDSETPTTPIMDSEITTEDIYINVNDNEDQGTWAELKENHEAMDDEFIPEDYKVWQPNGLFLLFNE